MLNYFHVLLLALFKGTLNLNLISLIFVYFVLFFVEMLLKDLGLYHYESCHHYYCLEHYYNNFLNHFHQSHTF